MATQPLRTLSPMPRGDDPEEVRAWQDYARSLGFIPPSPPFHFEPFEDKIKPRFYLLRKWVIWPVRRFIRRRMR